MNRYIPTSHVASAVKLSEVSLRDRTRALADHLGERFGRLRLYAIDELAEIAVAEFLHSHGVRLAKSYELARLHRRNIHAAVNSGAGEAPYMLVDIGDGLSDDYSLGASEKTAEERMRDCVGVIGLNLNRIIAAALDRLSDAMSALGDKTPPVI